MINHAVLAKAMHSRFTLFVSVTLAVLGTMTACIFCGEPSVLPTRGFVRGWDLSALPLNPDVILGLSAALNIVIVWLILLVNKTYNLLRTMTRLNASLFLLMELATPVVLYSLCPGEILTIIVLWCMALLYSLYGQQHYDTRRIFLVFAVLSACSSFDYTYVVYMPVFILACAQLKVISLRSVSALLIGIVTPWIIFFGFGIVRPESLQQPFDALAFPSFDSPSSELLIGIVIFTVFVTLVSFSQNAMKYIAYNAKSRSMISVVTVFTVVSAIAAIVDMSNVYSYLTLLNVCAAFQVTHLFTAVHNYGKSYICVMVIGVLYLMMFAIGLSLCILAH